MLLRLSCLLGLLALGTPAAAQPGGRAQSRAPAGPATPAAPATAAPTPITDPALLAQLWDRFPNAAPAPHDEKLSFRFDQILQAAGCTLVEVRRSQGQYFTLAQIGQAKVVMGLDTGAHTVSLEANLRRVLGVPLRQLKGEEAMRDFGGRELRAWAGTAPIALGGVDLEPTNVVLIDSPIPAGKWRPGLLGMSVLRRHGAMLDMARARLWVARDPNSRHGEALEADAWSAGYVQVRLRRASALRDRPVVPVTVNGVRGVMLLDTGDPRTTLSYAACKRVGVPMEPNPALKKTDYYGKDHAVYEGELRSFLIGTYPAPPHKARMVDYLDALGADLPREWGEFFGLLGNEALIASAAIVDCGRDRLYLADRAKPAAALEPSGNQQSLSERAF